MARRRARPVTAPRGLVAPALAIAMIALAACATEPGVAVRGIEPIPTDPSSPATASTPPDSTAPPPSAPPTSAPSPSSTAPPVDPLPGDDLELATVADVGDGKTPRSYDPFVAAVLGDLDAWWSETFPAVYRDPWVPLSGGIFPSYPGRDDVPGCGATRTEHRDVAEYAALYCADGDFIVYDDGDDSLLGSLVAEFGPAIMGVVLAHEYGHAVQARAGALGADLPTVYGEQQADCFAGAWFGWAASGASPLLRLTDSDVRGGLVAMVSVRDPVGVDQLSDGGHGSAFDRVGAFQEGFAGGAERCSTLLADPLPLMPNEFTSDADALNEGDMPYGYSGDTIAPLIVETLNAYWTFAVGEGFPTLSLRPIRSTDELDCSTPPVPVVTGVWVCPPARVVAVDEALAASIYDDPLEGRSDFGVAYLIASGWAEVAQRRLGGSLAGEARALANDCLVGAWALDLFPRPLRSEDDTNAGSISPGDLDEAVIAAITIGDAGAADDRIGSAFEKIDSFRDGVLGGLDACTARLD